MKLIKKNGDSDEHQLLIDKSTNSYDGNNHQQRGSSRLEWGESSWIRWPYALYFCWIIPTLSSGYKRTLTEDDLDYLAHADKCSTLYNKISGCDWTKTTLFRLIVNTFWKRFVFSGSLLIPYIATQIAQSWLFYEIVLYIGKYQNSTPTLASSTNYGYFYAVGLFLFAVIGVILQQQYYFCADRLDLMIRNLLTCMIYRRVLDINTAMLQQVTTAHAINLVISDATKFEDFINYLHFLWATPLQLVLNFVLLWLIIGLWPTLCGYIVIIVALLIQIILGRKFRQYRETTVTYSDKRIHAFQELINGCEVIKVYNWEKPMQEHVMRARQLELSSIRRASLLRALNMSLYIALIPVIGFTTFAGAWYLGYSLNAAKLFVALTFYGRMRLAVMYSLPLAVERLNEIYVVWKRIDAFIRLPTNQQQQTLSTPSNDPQQQRGTILMRDASFSWPNCDNSLSSININIESGTFVGIIGPVGSGKSSLFAAILGEMIQTNGQLDVNGSSFAYAAQSPWIFADTVRANILFGKPLDEQRYVSVLHACCLDDDLNAFGSSGDLTIIGEKGVNLSGGQKTRISLARAVYADADIYLLDDPLAAVDHAVAKQIYDQCIGPHGLLSKKTRLLITHQTQFLVESHQIIVLAHGKIQAQGRFDELPIQYENIEETNNLVEEEPTASPTTFDIGKATVDSQSVIEDETSENRAVNWSVWYSLFTPPPLGLFGLCLLLVLLAIGEFLNDGTNLWLCLHPDESNTDNRHESKFIYIYFSLTMATLIVLIIRSIYFFCHTLKGSNHLHNRMLSGILYTSMHFFESNPYGRLFNRASKDQQIIDETLPFVLFDAIQILLMAVGAVMILCIVNVWITILLIPVVPIFWMLRRYYMRSGRQLKRLQSISRSPVYALFSASLYGLATIRAFKVETDYIQFFMNRIDANTRTYINMISAAMWFGLILDLITALFSLVPPILAIMYRDKMDLSLIALTLMYCINMTGWFQGDRSKINHQKCVMSYVLSTVTTADVYC